MFKYFFHILEAMKQVGSFLTLAYHPFYGLEPHFLFFHSLGNGPFSMQDLNIVSKVFEVDSPQILSRKVIIIS